MNGDGIRFQEAAQVRKSLGRDLVDRLGFKGVFQAKHYREGRLIAIHRPENLITNEGKNKVLNVMFNGGEAVGTQITSWYMSLIDASGAVVAATDTYDDINGANGWDEFVLYDESTRPSWAVSDASGQAITSSAVAVFSINASGSVYGLFVCGGVGSANTKDDHAPGGTLWNGAAFGSGTATVENGDELKLTYTVSA
jgi:hypothetical protein